MNLSIEEADLETLLCALSAHLHRLKSEHRAEAFGNLKRRYVLEAIYREHQKTQKMIRTATDAALGKADNEDSLSTPDQERP